MRRLPAISSWRGLVKADADGRLSPGRGNLGSASIDGLWPGERQDRRQALSRQRRASPEARAGPPQAAIKAREGDATDFSVTVAPVARAGATPLVEAPLFILSRAESGRSCQQTGVVCAPWPLKQAWQIVQNGILLLERAIHQRRGGWVSDPRGVHASCAEYPHFTAIHGQAKSLPERSLGSNTCCPSNTR